MKIKGVIEDLKYIYIYIYIFNLKNVNSKYISRTFSDIVESVGSVHFQIVP